MSFEATIITKGDKTFATLFPLDGSDPVPVSNDHPQWERLFPLIIAKDPKALSLANLAVSVADYFSSLGERVTTKYGKLYLDGDELDNSLSKKIMECVETDGDPAPYVNFLEKVVTNPQAHSRTQLYNFLENYNLPITTGGNFLGYKGVSQDSLTVGKEKSFRSISKGCATVHATVQGVAQAGYIFQSIGDIVTMPRNQVAGSPTQACAAGLHVSTFDYAKGFGNTIIVVEVNPRDVVSVPTRTAKIRCCRYKVLAQVTTPLKETVIDVSTMISIDGKKASRIFAPPVFSAVIS